MIDLVINLSARVLYLILFFFSIALFCKGETFYRHEELRASCDLPKKCRSFSEDRIFGSGQFSLCELQSFLLKYSDRRVVIVDLRREFHGFIEGNPVSWKLEPGAYKEGSFQYNKGISAGTLQKEEKEFLRKNDAISEKELIDGLSLNLSYVRIPILDHSFPKEAEVDAFLALMQTLSMSDRIYFHCAGGKGRTTVAMCMADIFYNCHLFTVEEILQRQNDLGGSNLLVERLEGGRLLFLTFFYKYCLENRTLIESWSSWIKRQEGAFLLRD